MSRQEPEPSNRARPRANTTAFTSLWRRPRDTTPTSTPPPVPVPAPAIPPGDLIQALTPPAVPSLTHARTLASTLATYSPLPRRELLNPVLTSLCSNVSPTSVQAAGFDILSAYWENHEAQSLAISERLSYFSLFLGSPTTWGTELWEPRFKALRALTKYGEEIVGIESNVIDLLEQWIEGAFEGLLKTPLSLDRSEMAERERCLDLLVKFLNSVLTTGANASRITDEKMDDILQFYADLVDHALIVVDSVKEPPASPVSPSSPGSAGNPVRTAHRRNISSLSSNSIPTMSTIPPAVRRHPAELAINIYLSHVSAHIKTLPPTHMKAILPLLFRALAFCSTPLPRLSVTLESKKNTVEDRVMDMLNNLFGGQYSTTCMLVLRLYLFPPNTASNPAPSSPGLLIMTSLGAHRTFRVYVRRALAIRLARAYINRETAFGYSHSGAPGHMELQNEMMEKVWPKDDYLSNSIGMGDNGWDAGNLGQKLADSVGAWVGYETDSEKGAGWERIQQGRDEILEEAAGVLKDILQELDLRDEDRGTLDTEEAGVIGLTLLKLTGYVIPLK